MPEIDVKKWPNGFVVSSDCGIGWPDYWGGEKWSAYYWSYDSWDEAYAVAASRVLVGDGWLAPSITKSIG